MEAVHESPTKMARMKIDTHVKAFLDTKCRMDKATLIWVREALAIIEKKLSESSSVDDTLAKQLGDDRVPLKALRNHLEKDLLDMEGNRAIRLQDLYDWLAGSSNVQQDINESFMSAAFNHVRKASIDGWNVLGEEKTRAWKHWKRGVTERRWETRAEQYYGSVLKDGKEIFKWCAVLSTFINVTRARGYLGIHKMGVIVPKSTQNSHMSHLFGVESDNKNVARNCLPLHTAIENMWDNQRITFVPAETDVHESLCSGEPREYKLIVLDESVYKETHITWHIQTTNVEERISWRQLNGRILSFPETTHGHPRPATRFMYYRHLINYAWSVRQKWSADARAQCPSGKIWASSTSLRNTLLRKSVLHTIAMKLCNEHLPPEFYEGMIFEDESSRPDAAIKDLTAAMGLIDAFATRHKYCVNPGSDSEYERSGSEDESSKTDDEWY